MSVHTTSGYREALLRKYKTGQAMELDLSGVTEIDTSGLQLLVALQKHLHGEQCDLRLRHPSETVRRVLELTRLAESFDDQIEEALQ